MAGRANATQIQTLQWTFNPVEKAEFLCDVSYPEIASNTWNTIEFFLFSIKNSLNSPN